MKTSRRLSTALALSGSLVFGSIAVVYSAERRAPAPKFSGESFRGVFFTESSQAIRGTRPEMGTVQKSAAPAAVAKAPAGASGGSEAAVSGFSALISPATLEDEIKRLRLEFDTGITTPAAFQSGGFQQARVQLTMMASLFAVINEHNGEVRWKKDAPAARDLFARTAVNCKSGSGQVYNEVKQRKADLEDLVSGSGLANRQAEAENDWGVVTDRVPLMIYLESLLEGPLKEGTQDANAVKAEGDRVRRAAELVGIVGEILTKEGLADADDTEYAAMCKEMTAAAGSISKALDQGDAAAVSKAAGAVSQSCAKCHESYR
jgi:hypothetical protein